MPQSQPQWILHLRRLHEWVRVMSLYFIDTYKSISELSVLSFSVYFIEVICLICRKLFRLLYDRQLNSWNNKELNMCGPEMCTAPLINYYEAHILSFGEDEGGNPGFL